MDSQPSLFQTPGTPITDDGLKSFKELPVIRDVALYRALEESYSAGEMFRNVGRKSKEFQPIETPVEHEGNFYISLGGSAALCRKNSRGESIAILEFWATRLWKPEEYTGEARTFVSHLGESPRCYEGLVVVDPQDRKWVIGEERFCVQVFENDNDVLFDDPDGEIK